MVSNTYTWALEFSNNIWGSSNLRKSWDLLHRSCWVTLEIHTLRTSPRMEVPLTKTYFYLESVQPLSKIFEFQTNHWKRNENFSCKRDEQKCRTFDKLQKNARYQKLLKNSLGLLCKIEKEHLVRDIEIFIYLLIVFLDWNHLTLIF